MTADGAAFDGTVEFDPGRGLYSTRFTVRSDVPSRVVVEAAAAIRGDDPSAVEPLHEFVDTDALGGSMRSAAGDRRRVAEVTVAAYGSEATVSSRGTITLEPSSRADDADSRGRRGG